MAKKPTPSKAPAKKPAAAVKAKPPAKRPPAKRPAAKPVAKASVKPASKVAPKPAVKAPVKPAPKPKSAAVAAPAPKPAEVKTVAVPAAKPAEVKAVAAPAAKPAVPAAIRSGVTGAALTVSAQASPGMAASGNTHPANLLIVVTCGGWPVAELSRDHFTLMEHFEVPGQTAPFSNNITSFRNAGTGAYLLQTKPINGAPWRSGHHLGQILVSSADDQQGQAAFKLIVR